MIRLICLPHAGGSAQTYRSWAAALAPTIDVLPLADTLVPPFAVYGHSMGAVIAFAVSRELRRRGRPMPSHLVLAAHAAPHIAPVEPLVHTMPEPALLRI